MIRKEIIAYNTDAYGIIGKVEKVVFPKNVKEVSEIVRITNMDIVPRGAGTGFEGGVVPNNSLVIDMTKMNKIVSFNSSKKTLVVEAGIILKELNEKLVAKGYEFPIDVLNKDVSSIGGMIATNASGKRAMRYGSIRDWLDEIEFINGKGELIKTSKADLMDVCGMEGITGIITSAKIRVLPKITRSFFIFQTDKLENVLHVGRRLKSEKEVCSVILFSKKVSKMLGFAEKYYLFVEFDSERGKIKGLEYDELLKKIENIYYTLGLNDYYISEDPRLFFDKIQEFLEILDLRDIPYFSYLGNGIIHPFFKDSEKEKRINLLAYIKKTQMKLGKYGYGLRRKEYLDSFESKLIQRVKQRHDPSGKLNKGKLVDFSGYVEQKTQIKNKSIDAGKKSDLRENNVEKVKESKLRDSFTDNSGKSIISSPEFSDKAISQLLNSTGKIAYGEERLEIKPSLGEELTAKNIPSECNIKDPEMEIEEFIKKVEQIEKIEQENIIEDDFDVFEEDNRISQNNKIQQVENTIKKYSMEGQTKLNFLERKEVEKIAKEIPKEIAKDSQLPLKPRLTADYSAIKKSVEDGLIEGSDKKRETSQEERDLISKIMGNRFGNIKKGEKGKGDV